MGRPCLPTGRKHNALDGRQGSWRSGHRERHALRASRSLQRRDVVIARERGCLADECSTRDAGLGRFRSCSVVVLMASRSSERGIFTRDRAQSPGHRQYGKDDEHGDADGPEVPTHDLSITRLRASSLWIEP